MGRIEGGCAVGLRFTGDALPGLVTGVREELPGVTVELAPEVELEVRWAGAPSPQPVFERPRRDGTPFLRIDRDEAAGYRVWAAGYGTHLISADGEACTSHLPAGPAWRGLRLLASQAMPLLATLRGHEVIHAAGVVVGDRLVGLAAPSGTGKSSTACNLIAQGARFFADDVLALDLAGGRVRAHPGPRLVNVSAHDLEAIPERRSARIGTRLDGGERVRIEPPGFPGSLPLAALVFLDRRQRTAATAMRPVENVPARLLGSSFLSYLDAPTRLARQLEVASALAETVPLASLEVAGTDCPAEAARHVREWVATL